MRESNAQSKYGRIGVVIPALDEELSLRELLPRLGETRLGQIVVVPKCGFTRCATLCPTPGI